MDAWGFYGLAIAISAIMDIFLYVSFESVLSLLLDI